MRYYTYLMNIDEMHLVGYINHMEQINHKMK
jgi:hypothetical protein